MVKLSILMQDLGDFAKVNEIISGRAEAYVHDALGVYRRDVDRFAAHFKAPVVEVSGRTYPVEVRYRLAVEAGVPWEA